MDTSFESAGKPGAPSCSKGKLVSIARHLHGPSSFPKSATHPAGTTSAGLSGVTATPPEDATAHLERLLDDVSCYVNTAEGAFSVLAANVANDREDADSLWAALYTLRLAQSAFAELYDLAHPMMAASRRAAHAAQPEDQA